MSIEEQSSDELFLEFDKSALLSLLFWNAPRPETAPIQSELVAGPD
jgi:hypothetical protein